METYASQLNHIVDTQCGFKAFRADVVRAIVEDLIEKRFAIDIELLLRTELRRAGAIAKVPVAWIDSEAASTTTGINPYLSMLQSVAQMYRKYLPPNPKSDAFAHFVESLDESAWDALLNNIPQEIADGDPARFGHFDAIGPEDLAKALR